MTDEEIRKLEGFVKACNSLKDAFLGIADEIAEAIAEAISKNREEQKQTVVVQELTVEEYAEYLQELKRMAEEDQKLIPVCKKPRWRPVLIRKASGAKHLLRYFPVGFQ